MIFHYQAGNEQHHRELGKKLRELSDGEWTIQITKNRPIRSLGANRYLWGIVYKQIALVIGHTAEEIHEMCKFKFNAKTIEFPNGMREVLSGSTHDMTDAEMAEYTDKVKKWASTYFNVKFVDQRDVDYTRWSQINEEYDRHANI